MDVTGYHLHRRYDPILNRAAAIADQAAALVQQRMREPMPATRIVVAKEGNCPLALIENYRATLGTELWPPARPATDYMGITTVSPDGALIVINADEHDGSLRQLDETLVHELVHAVQLGRPGKRDEELRGVRHNFGLERMRIRSAWKQNRATRIDEREAQALEYLARDLR
ncbi:hypothetical protein [Streptomyces sp. NPDC012888]|uniref:hypothetical protein n=1 Tax=Streptomyces sp. NPDC012888 TaxID=3364855 RepID=UPI0036AD3E48